MADVTKPLTLNVAVDKVWESSPRVAELTFTINGKSSTTRILGAVEGQALYLPVGATYEVSSMTYRGYTFNGCTVTITKRQDPYGYVNGNGREATKSARYWGKFVFPNGVEKTFAEERGGAIARSTGFSVKTERALYKEQGDKYILPYLR